MVWSVVCLLVVEQEVVWSWSEVRSFGFASSASARFCSIILLVFSIVRQHHLLVGFFSIGDHFFSNESNHGYVGLGGVEALDFIHDECSKLFAKSQRVGLGYSTDRTMSWWSRLCLGSHGVAGFVGLCSLQMRKVLGRFRIKRKFDNFSDLSGLAWRKVSHARAAFVGVDVSKNWTPCTSLLATNRLRDTRHRLCLAFDLWYVLVIESCLRRYLRLWSRVDWFGDLEHIFGTPALTLETSATINNHRPSESAARVKWIDEKCPELASSVRRLVLKGSASAWQLIFRGASMVFREIPRIGRIDVLSIVSFCHFITL